MTPEQISSMVTQAGIFRLWPCPYIANEDELQSFAQLVRNAALEEAAESCENYTVNPETAAYSLSLVSEEIRSLKS